MIDACPGGTYPDSCSSRPKMMPVHGGNGHTRMSALGRFVCVNRRIVPFFVLRRGRCAWRDGNRRARYWALGGEPWSGSKVAISAVPGASHGR